MEGYERVESWRNVDKLIHEVRMLCGLNIFQDYGIIDWIYKKMIIKGSKVDFLCEAPSAKIYSQTNGKPSWDFVSLICNSSCIATFL